MPRLGKSFITALDIGSSKTSCFIAEILPSGSLNVIGIGHQISGGIKSGTITDIKLAEHSIRNAVGAAEQMAGVNVDRVVVNISGCKQQSHRAQAKMALSGHEITARDIHTIISQGAVKFSSEEREVIHAIPIDYTIDEMRGITDPTGMRGKELTAQMHVVTASTGALLNITTCLAKCHLDVEDYITSPYASAISCLSDDEKMLGSILLDFGGGHTSIVIFKNGNMVYTGFVPVGGMHVTNDIAHGLATSMESAERVKTLYGNLISTVKDEREIIDIPQVGDDGRSEMNHIQRSTLVGIIKPRIDEIAEFIAKHIDNSGYGNIGGNIVITGGGSQIGGLKELIAYSFAKPVRQGIPKPIEGIAESTKGAAFSTCSGILSFTLQKRNLTSYDFMGRISKFNSPLQRLVSWFKDNF
jgi:cell division protein FtsA